MMNHLYLVFSVIQQVTLRCFLNEIRLIVWTINAKALSKRIGMNQSLLAQYIKGIKKHSVIQTKRILQGVH